MDTFSDINSKDAYIYQKPQKQGLLNRSALNKIFVVGVAFAALSGMGYTILQLNTAQNVQSQASTQPVTIIASASKSTVSVGEEFTVSLLMDVKDRAVTGTQLYFSYPEEYVEALSVSGGSFLPQILAPGTAAGGSGFIVVGTSTTQIGSGIVATVTFRAKKVSSEFVEITINNTRTKIVTPERVAVGVSSSPARLSIIR